MIDQETAGTAHPQAQGRFLCLVQGRTGTVPRLFALGIAGALYTPKFARTSLEETMRVFSAALGILFLALGAVGMVLPVLPTTPFLLLAAFFFARSSKRLNDWFLTTRVYKKYLDGLVRCREMPLKGKLALIGTITVLMGIGFALMGAFPVGRAVLAAIWLAHVLYFGFRVKTVKAPPKQRDTETIL